MLWNTTARRSAPTIFQFRVAGGDGWFPRTNRWIALLMLAFSSTHSPWESHFTKSPTLACAVFRQMSPMGSFSKPVWLHDGFHEWRGEAETGETLIVQHFFVFGLRGAQGAELAGFSAASPESDSSRTQMARRR